MTSREREEAIECCLITAALWEHKHEHYPEFGYSDVEANRPMPNTAVEKARLATAGNGCFLEPLKSLPANRYLEAASLLADNWNLGDPVVRR